MGFVIYDKVGEMLFFIGGVGSTPPQIPLSEKIEEGFNHFADFISSYSKYEN